MNPQQPASAGSDWGDFHLPPGAIPVSGPLGAGTQGEVLPVGRDAAFGSNAKPGSVPDDGDDDGDDEFGEFAGGDAASFSAADTNGAAMTAAVPGFGTAAGTAWGDDDEFGDFEGGAATDGTAPAAGAAPAASQPAAVAAAPLGVSRDVPLPEDLFAEAPPAEPEGAPGAGGGSVAAAAVQLPEYAKGADVWYRERDGSWTSAKVVSVDRSIIPPSYGILLGGDRFRETEGYRLAARAEGQPPPPAPPQRSTTEDSIGGVAGAVDGPLPPQHSTGGEAVGGVGSSHSSGADGGPHGGGRSRAGEESSAVAANSALEASDSAGTPEAVAAPADNAAASVPAQPPLPQQQQHGGGQHHHRGGHHHHHHHHHHDTPSQQPQQQQQQPTAAEPLLDASAHMDAADDEFGDFAAADAAPADAAQPGHAASRDFCGFAPAGAAAAPQAGTASGGFGDFAGAAVPAAAPAALGAADDSDFGDFAAAPCEGAVAADAAQAPDSSAAPGEQPVSRTESLVKAGPIPLSLFGEDEGEEPQDAPLPELPALVSPRGASTAGAAATAAVAAVPASDAAIGSGAGGAGVTATGTAAPAASAAVAPAAEGGTGAGGSAPAGGGWGDGWGSGGDADFGEFEAAPPAPAHEDAEFNEFKAAPAAPAPPFQQATPPSPPPPGAAAPPRAGALPLVRPAGGGGRAPPGAARPRKLSAYAQQLQSARSAGEPPGLFPVPAPRQRHVPPPAADLLSLDLDDAPAPVPAAGHGPPAAALLNDAPLAAPAGDAAWGSGGDDDDTWAACGGGDWGRFEAPGSGGAPRADESWGADATPVSRDPGPARGGAAALAAPAPLGLCTVPGATPQEQYMHVWTEVARACAAHLQDGARRLALAQQRGLARQLLSHGPAVQYYASLSRVYCASQLVAAAAGHYVGARRRREVLTLATQCELAWEGQGGALRSAALDALEECGASGGAAAFAASLGGAAAAVELLCERERKDAVWERGLCAVSLLPLEALEPHVHVADWHSERRCVVLLGNLWTREVSRSGALPDLP